MTYVEKSGEKFVEKFVEIFPKIGTIDCSLISKLKTVLATMKGPTKRGSHLGESSSTRRWLCSVVDTSVGRKVTFNANFARFPLLDSSAAVLADVVTVSDNPFLDTNLS